MRTTLNPAGREAGDTYSKLAEVHVKQDSKADAAQAYVEASKAYQRVDKSSKLACKSASISCHIPLSAALDLVTVYLITDQVTSCMFTVT